VDRGDVWWADLGEPRGSGSGDRRPVLIVQANAFNRSQIATTIGVVLTSNLRLLDAPGNVLVARSESGLPKESVANVSQVVTLDRDVFSERAGSLSAHTMRAVDAGLRLVLDL